MFPTLLIFIMSNMQPIISQELVMSGNNVNLEIWQSGNNSIRVRLMPICMEDSLPLNPALSVDQGQPAPVLKINKIEKPIIRRFGNLKVEISGPPLEVIVRNSENRVIQKLLFADDGRLLFKVDDNPILGMGEGGPRVGNNWKSDTIEFDRRGRLHKMEPRWQADAYGSRNPVALLAGTGGWGLFIASPWGQFDLRGKEQGIFIPAHSIGLELAQQSQKNQQLNMGKGLPPPETMVPGLFDIFVFDASDPELFLKDISDITGRAVLPPKWALGYMQSHRTLEDESQMLNIVKTFRGKQLPLDAVIYLGTGFCPRGWNKEQPSFEFNREVFKRDPAAVIEDLHNENVKVVLHIVPWDRDKLSGLHGTIPAHIGEKFDASHIMEYWKQHIDLVKAGVDAWWPDEGDWFNLHERIKRHQLYYEGPLYTTPNVRPWSLHRNGYLGVSRWGGWVWSGDTESSWKTLEGQIAVGINHSLSLSPFWGSDIGGFYPSEELDGELYARWFQFGAFCPSFRSHGRTWWTRLPWGWGLKEMGPKENPQNPLESELNNPLIEEICRKYSELRYHLLSYNYTLAWEAREKGLPMMRALWIHYPKDHQAQSIGDQYLWGRDMIVAPVYQKKANTREVYLPRGEWYDWWTGEKLGGGRKVIRKVDLSVMPIYVRAGAIIPVDPLRQFTSQKVDEPLEIRVYTGSDGFYQLYQDDGISLDYMEEEGRLIIEFRWDDSKNMLSINNSGSSSIHLSDAEQRFRLRLMPSGREMVVEYRPGMKRMKYRF